MSVIQPDSIILRSLSPSCICTPLHFLTNKTWSEIWVSRESKEEPNRSGFWIDDDDASKPVHHSLFYLQYIICTRTMGNKASAPEAPVSHVACDTLVIPLERLCFCIILFLTSWCEYPSFSRIAEAKKGGNQDGKTDLLLLPRHEKTPWWMYRIQGRGTSGLPKTDRGSQNVFTCRGIWCEIDRWSVVE